MIELNADDQPSILRLKYPLLMNGVSRLLVSKISNYHHSTHLLIFMNHLPNNQSIIRSCYTLPSIFLTINEYIHKILCCLFNLKWFLDEAECEKQ